MSYQKNGDFLGFIPPVTRNLLIVNAVVWLLCGPLHQGWLVDMLALRSVGVGFRAYQLVSYMFTHVELGHLFFNMFALFMFGKWMEEAWGPKRYAIYYLVTGVGAGLVQLLVCFLSGGASMTIGASGAVFGLLLAFGMTFPNVPMMLIFFPVPIKAKYLVAGYGVVEFFYGLAGSAGDNVAHFAHLGGMLFGIVLILFWRAKQKRNGNFFF
jgi:membrane associated rhomboid family serine protease